MGTTEVVLLALLMQVQISVVRAQKRSPDGCYHDDPFARSFRHIGSDYVPSQLTPKICYDSCDKRDYRFSAVTEGRFCLCGTSVNTTGGSKPAECNLPCPGDSSQTCGGHLHAEPYQLPISSKLSIEDPGVVAAYHPKTFSLTKEPTSNGEVYVDFGDGTPVVGKADLAFEHTYREAGSFVMSANTSDDSELTTRIIKVEYDVTEPVVKCPDYVARKGVFSCNITAAQGSHHGVRVSFDNRKTVAFFPKAASVPYTAGVIDGEDSTESSFSGYSSYYWRFFLVNQTFTKEATLVGWEFSSKSAGLARFEVWRPECRSETFCFQSKKCIRKREDCNYKTTTGAVQCTGDSVYSISAKSCINKNGKPVRKSPPTVSKYKLVDWTQVSTSANQHQHVKLQDDEHIHVQPGDIIGVYIKPLSIVMAKNSSSANAALQYWKNYNYSKGYINTPPSSVYDFVPKVKAHMVQATLPFEFKQSYCSLGPHNVSAAVENSLSTKVAFDNFTAIESVNGTRIICEPAGTQDRTHEFTAHVDNGSLVEYRWTFGDGRNITTSNATVEHIYMLPGTFEVTLEAFNPVSSQNVSVEVFILGEVVNLTIKHDVATVLGEYTNVSWEVSQGTNVTFDITLGDGQEIVWSENGTFKTTAINASLSRQGIYITSVYIAQCLTANGSYKLAAVHAIADKSGELQYMYGGVGYYNFTVNASNLVSFDYKKVYLPVQTVIEDFTINHPVVLPYKEKSNVSFDLVGGSHWTMNATFNGMPVTEYYFMKNESFLVIPAHFLDSFDTVVLHCSVENLVTPPIKQNIRIKIQNRIKNMKITCPNPIVRNDTISCDFDFGTTNTGACYRIDLSSRDDSIVCFGNKSQCIETYSTECTHTEQCNSFPGPVCRQTDNNPGSRAYYELGRQFITMTAINLLSKEQVQVIDEMTVTKGPCYSPVINLERPNRVSHGGALNVNRSEKPEIYSNVMFNCTYSNRGYFFWRIFQNKKEITDLMDTVVNGTGLDILRLDMRALQYGLYQVELNVSVVDADGIDSTGILNLNVTKTPLVGSLVGGRLKNVKWGLNYTIDAQNETYDLDLWNNSDKTGMTFQWFCKRACEEWPAFGDNFTIHNHNFQHNCNETGYTGGCIKQSINAAPGLLSNTTKGTLLVDTFNMFEERSIDLMVVVRKDTRTLVIKQRVNIVKGDPPDISIWCRTNCRKYMNPSSRFSLESRIKGHRSGMVYEYEWKITEYSGGLIGARPEYRYPWKSKTNTGINSANLALQPNTFNMSRKFLLLEVHCNRQGSTAVGLGTREFYINDIPKLAEHGKCSVDPKNGTAWKTRYKVNCSEFKDEDGIEVYHVLSRIDDRMPFTVHFTGKNLSAAEPFPLSMGLKENNYSIQIQVKATDKHGSYVYVNNSVQVLPMLPETAKDVQENLTSGDAMATYLNKLSASEVLPAISTLANLLNSDTPSEAGTEEDENATLSAKEEEKQKMTQVKEQMITELKDKRLFSLKDVEQLSSVLATVTYNTQHISETSAETATGYISEMASALHKITHSDDPPAETMETTAKYVINALGNVMKSTADEEEARQDSSKHENTTMNPKVRWRLNSLREKVLNISDTVMSRKVAGEVDSKIVSPTMNMSVVKRFMKKFENEELKAGNDNSFKAPSKVAMFGPANDTTEFVQAKVISYPTNPFIWASDVNETTINSVVRELYMKDDQDEEVRFSDLTENFEIYLPRTKMSEVTTMKNTTKLITEKMIIYRVILEAKASLNIRVLLDPSAEQTNYSNATSTTTPGYDAATDNRTVGWIVYVRNNNPPDDTAGEYDHRCLLPRLYMEDTSLLNSTNVTNIDDSVTITNDIETYTTDSVTSTNDILTTTNEILTDTNHNVTNTTDKATYTYGPTSKEPLGDVNMCIFNPNRTEKGAVYIGVRQIYLNETLADKDAEFVATLLDGLETLEYGESSYIMEIYSEKCNWFDEENNTWSMAGCEVGPGTTLERTQCLCNHLTSFGSGFASISINTFDFGNPFANLDQNPAVFATMVTILGIYLLFLIWARKADKLDHLKAGVTPLLDNNPNDKYLYEILICTGARKNAGTTAKVCMVLSGDQAETEPRLIWDDKRPVLQTSAVDAFLMAIPNPLGDLSHLRIWHDNSGNNPSWFFSRMQVTDLQRDVKYFFICDRWLAVEEDDGLVDRVLPVAGISELTDFNHLFWRRTQRDLSDNHIWFSVFRRPARSTFTRVQRLTCCLSLLFCSMMANILFYKTEDPPDPTQVFHLGPINISMREIIIGFLVGLIVFPANVFIVAIFRYAKPKPSKSVLGNGKRSSSKEEDQSQAMASELKQQEEFLDTGDLNKFVLASPSVPVKLNTQPGSKSVESNYLRPLAPSAKADVNTVPSSDKKKKCSFTFPWWFTIIGYVMSACCIGVAFYMTVGIASVFGKKKAEGWLISFVFSVIQSIFLMQPLKVLCIALFYALIIRDPATDEDEHKNPEVKADETLLHQPSTQTDDMKNTDGESLDSSEAEKAEKLKDLKAACQIPSPPDQECLEQARKKRFKEIQMHKVIREVILYLVFLYLLMMIGYTNRDPRSHTVYRSLSNSFMLGAYNNHPNATLGLSSLGMVTNRHTFFDWASKSLLPGLYSTEFYDKRSYHWQKGHVADNQGYLMGEPRFRQLRVKPERCPHQVSEIRSVCRYGYSYWTQEEESYKQGWVPVDSNSTDEPDLFWTYRSATDLDTYPYWGKHSTYYGGGYVATLGKTVKTANATLKLLENTDWIDEKTRVIFVEFLIFNPNINLFSISQIAIEISETGAFYPYFKMHVMRLSRYVGPFMYFVMALEACTVCFIIFNVVSSIRRLIKEKLDFFKKFWNVYQVIFLGVCLTAIVMFVYRLIIANILSSKIKKKPNAYHSFENVAVWDEVYGNLLGLIIFLANVQCLHLLRFNRRISLFGSTLRYAARPLLQFSVIFFIVFLSFAQLAYLVFSSTVIDFSSFIKTMETLSVQMLNKFDFNKMVKADRVFGPTVFFFFALIVSFILLNFFLTIVLEAFIMVKHDVSKQSNEYEIVSFIIDRFRNAMGMSTKGNKNKTEEKLEMEYFVEGSHLDDNMTAGLQQRLDALYIQIEEMLTPEERQIMNKQGSKPRKKKIILSA